MTIGHQPPFSMMVPGPPQCLLWLLAVPAVSVIVAVLPVPLVPVTSSPHSSTFNFSPFSPSSQICSHLCLFNITPDTLPYSCIIDLIWHTSSSHPKLTTISSSNPPAFHLIVFSSIPLIFLCR